MYAGQQLRLSGKRACAVCIDDAGGKDSGGGGGDRGLWHGTRISGKTGLSIAFRDKNFFWDMSQKGISFFSAFSNKEVIDREWQLAYTECTPQNIVFLC